MSSDQLFWQRCLDYLLDEGLDERGSLSKQFFARSPLLITAIGLIAGIVIQHFINPPIGWVLAATTAAIIIAAIVYRFGKESSRVYTAAWVAFIAFACLGAIRLIVFYRVD